MTELDALIVGGGHNGLVCAAMLARAGRTVTVVEARDVVGGFATTEAPFSNHPDVRMPMAAMDLVSANLPPSVIDDLDLAAHGLTLIDVDPFYCHVTPDGRSFAFWRSIDRTCDELAAFSAHDARRYRRLMTRLVALWRTLGPYLHAHPTRPGLRPVLAALGQGARHVLSMPRVMRTMLSSPGAAIEAHFENDSIRAALANFAAASGSPLDEPGSGIILAMMAMQHEWGVRRPVGGMGAFSDAIRRAAEHHGATILTGAPVERILIEHGRATGVVLKDGGALRADHVVGTVDPKTLFLKLLPAGTLKPKIVAELEALGVWRANIAPMRVDLLVSEAPAMVLPPARADLLRHCSMLLGPDFQGTRRFIQAAQAGVLADGGIPIWPASPSAIDRSLVPPGSPMETFYIFIPAVPYRLADGRRWADLGETVVQRTIATMERVMPGLSDRIVARAVRTPDDIAAVSGITRGSAYHADMSLWQMGPRRPTPSLAGYRSPIPGLWHSGAGAHPMASVNGLSGALTAETILRSG